MVAALGLAALGGCFSVPAVTAGVQCCASNDDCVDGFACTEGQCRARCLADQDCNAGETCSAASGTCVLAQERNNPCRDNVVNVPDAATGGRDGSTGPSDASSRDVPVTRRDAGSPDRWWPDEDGSTPDDAGPDPDASAPDASRPDASRPDASRPDASLPDAGPTCNPDDNFEPNDNAATAAPVAGTSASGRACNGDEDWLRLETLPGGNVAVTLSTGGADVLAFLADADGQPLADLVRGAAGTYSAFISNTSEAVLLRIRAEGPSTVEWSAQVDVQPPNGCTQDAFEPNDNIQQARPLGASVAAVICPMDQDFFSFTVPAAGTITLDLRGAPTSGDLDLELLTQAGQRVAVAQGTNAQETIMRALQPGTYVARVFGFGRALGAYTLSVTQVASCMNDAQEPNDSFPQAVVTGSSVTGILCPGDADFFNMPAGADGATLAISASAWTLRVANSANGTLLTRTGSGAGSVLIPAGNDRVIVEVRGTAAQPNAVPYTVTITPNVPQCTGQDGFEPNNTRDTATTLPLDQQVEALVCNGDTDHFAVTVPPMLTVVFTVADPLQALTGVTLFNARTGQVLATGARAGSTWTLQAASTGDALVVAITSTRPEEVVFAVQATALNVACVDDRSEPNDSLAQSRSLASTAGPYAICPGNEDWYFVDAAAGDVLQVTMQPQTMDDLDVALLDSAGNQLGISQNSPPQSEFISFQVTRAGRYHVRVYGFPPGPGGDAQGTYDLRVTLGPAGCADDGLEPNNTTNTAVVLSPGSAAAATSCPGNPDVYTNRTPLMGNLVVSVDFPGGSDLALLVQDANGGVMGRVNSTVSPLRVVVPGGAVPVFATVTSNAPPQGTGYVLEFQPDTSASCTGADNLEPNNSAQRATGFQGPSMSGAVCGMDEDWFRVPSLAGEIVTALVSSTGGTPQVEIRNLNGQVIATGSQLPGGGFGAVAQGVTGNVFVRILAPNVASDVRYTLTVNRVNPNMCVPDAFEPNDSISAARPYTGTVQAQICAGDRDFFSVSTMATGARISVQLLMQPGSGNIDVRLRSSNGTILATGQNGAGIPENVAAVVGAAGRYFVEVYGAPEGSANAGQAPYLLSVTVENTAPTCSEDGNEENDNAFQARPLGPDGNTVTSGVLCGNDQDWYVMFIGQQADVSIFASYDVGQVRMTVQNAVGQVLLSRVVFPGEEVLLSQVTPGPLTIGLVASATVSTGINYELFASVSTPPPMCNVDPNEPNDSPFEATPLAPGSATRGVLCASGDVDVFTLPTMLAGTLSITLNTMRMDAGIDVFILDQDFMTILAFSEGQVGPTRTASVQLPGPGSFPVVVADSTGVLVEGVDYVLTTTLTTAAMCVDDAFEPNDSTQNATGQAVNASVPATSCPGNQDHFAYGLARGVQYTATLTDGAGRTDGRVEVITPNGTVLGSAPSNSQGFRFRAPANGRHVLRVTYTNPPGTGVGYVVRLARP